MKQQIKFLLIPFLLLLLIFNCEQPNSTKEVTTPTTSNFTFNYTSSNPIKKIRYSHFSSSSETLAINGTLDGKTIYLVKANKSTFSATSYNTGSASSISEPMPEPIIYNNSTRQSKDSIITKNYPPSTEFNNNPPVFNESEILRNRTITKPQKSYFTGSTRQFWVEDASGNWQQINTTCRAVGEQEYNCKQAIR